MTSHDNVTDIVGRLQDVYGKLTPGAIERADLDGMAFTVADAITDLATLRKQLENAREALQFYANYLSFPLNAWVQPTKVDYSMAGDGHWPDGPPIPSSELLADQGKIAREALKGQPC